VNAPEQLLVPVYVPAIDEFDTSLPVPSIVALQPGNPGIPPAGTVTVNLSDASERVPVRLPLKTTVPSAVLAVTEPDTEVPDCETVHDIVPEPVESEAGPEYVPLSVMAGTVELGLLGLPQAVMVAESAIAMRQRLMRNDEGRGDPFLRILR